MTIYKFYVLECNTWECQKTIRALNIPILRDKAKEQGWTIVDTVIEEHYCKEHKILGEIRNKALIRGRN